MSQQSHAWLAVAALMLSLMPIYFIYFKDANKSFETGTVGAEGLPEELQRWQKWHWLRTTISFIAFVLALMALTQGERAF